MCRFGSADSGRYGGCCGGVGVGVVKRFETEGEYMKFAELWTLIWKQTGELVPGHDDGAEGMLMTTEDAAKDEARRQNEMYADSIGEIVAERVEL